jgi:hypothetical protein
MYLLFYLKHKNLRAVVIPLLATLNIMSISAVLLKVYWDIVSTPLLSKEPTVLLKFAWGMNHGLFFIVFGMLCYVSWLSIQATYRALDAHVEVKLWPNGPILTQACLSVTIISGFYAVYTL